MAQANAVSDLERAEHLAYADSKGVKRVSIFNDGVQVNAATEETLVATNSLLTSKISTLNSTTQQLGVNETWTGTWEDVTQYAEAIVTIYTTHSSAQNGLKIQWSMNGTDIQGDDLFSISASSGKTFSFPCQTKYFRVSYTNDGVATTTLQIQSSLKVRASKGSSHRLKDPLVQEDDAIVTKTLVAGFTTAGGGGIVDVKVNPSGSLQIGGTLDDITTLSNLIEARTQTPTLPNAINVQIGPGDPISNIPVVMDFTHHQCHEGETHRAQDIQASLGTGTVKYSVTVPANIYPHLVVSCDIYNGAARIDIYEGATITGGTPIVSYNRNRNKAATISSETTFATGITSTTGTLIESFYTGAGAREAGTNRPESEIILKANTVYRVDLVGLVVGTQAIIAFNHYEDLGV